VTRSPLPRLAALPLVIALVSLLAGCGDAPRRVLVLGFDGLDPATVDLLLAEGKLPNFARLRREGAYGRLQSPPPLLSPILWTTVATGKPASAHGIGHFVAVNPTTGEQLPVTSHMRRVKALWNIASEQGKTVDVVGWWATWPAETIRGSMVSDHTCYHFLFPEDAAGAQDPTGVTSPPALLDQMRPLIRRQGDIGASDLAPFVDVPAADLARPFAFDDELSHFRWALATAQTYSAIGLDLWRRERPDLALVYIEATDSASHLFGHLFRAQGLAGELAAQQARYGHAVEAMYAYADTILGQYLAAADRHTTVVVLSDHGFMLGTLPDDPSMTRDLRRVSERYHREQGILYLWGEGVRTASRLDQPQLQDVAPTILALLGLPLADDMPGRFLAEGLRFAAPAGRKRSYESTTPTTAAPDAGGAATPGTAPSAPTPANPPVDAAMLEHLKSLGYLDASSPSGDRNLAAVAFTEGRYADAAAAYAKLVAANPDDAGLRTSLAGALGALGRYDEARSELEQALVHDPLNAEAHHNLAVLDERAGRPDAAIAEYRQALRYNPQYEPSRQALARLGTAASPPVATDAARQATALAEQASQAAKNGDYAGAMRLLDAAEKLAPDLALIFHYRSNVAYLAGDQATAVRALERALALEPDNALFRQNLAWLRSQPAPTPPKAP
jgi:Flp pilus assembly protein TadD